MRAYALLLATLVASACASKGPDPRTVDGARHVDEDGIAQQADLDGPAYAGRWVVVQRGAVVAAASLPDDAVRAAERAGPSSPHRFIFRPVERGARLYRLAYLAEGGIVAGRRFLSDLGLAADAAGGKTSHLRGVAGATGADIARGSRLRLEISTLDGVLRRSVEAAFDPDFDGGLLLPRDVAAALELQRFEVPGDAEVQVALGRPFRARRATVIARLSAMDVSGAVETVYEESPARK